MGPANRRGAPAAELGAASPIDVDQLRDRLAAGEWIVDLGARGRYAEGHLAGAINMELSTHFTTYLGWVIPPGAPITLVGSAEEISEARRALSRIGLDDPIAALRQTSASLMHTSPRAYARADFRDMATDMDPGTDVVLDVRRDDEWRSGHISDAVHIPLPELLERLGEIPMRRLWVHCATGFRASIAASLLDRSGFTVTLVDDDFEHAARAGLVVELDSYSNHSTFGEPKQ